MSDFREDGAAALEWSARYLERLDDLPVLAQVKPGELSAKLPLSAPEQGEPFANVLRDLDELIVPALTNWQHPRFFAYFATTASEPGILAELLAATLNQVAILWRASPASTELELRTVDWVRQLLGLPDGWHGHIEDTASTSTLAALIAARHITGRNVVVCSEHAHSSVEKAARMLDMELRKVAADEELSMRTDGLELGDVAAVVATVGSTSFAAVDPVRELAALAHAAGAWLHVDAAYAGSSWICEEERPSQDGVELADSLVVNPHKWLMVPMDCSLLWTSRPDDLRAAFSLTPEYLRTDDDTYALSDYGPALGRRFRSLKLWAVLRCYGREGLQQLLREHIRLANLFAEWVEADPDWELCLPVRFSLVVFRHNGSDEENERILARANASGDMFLSHTKLHGRYVLRLAIGNARTTEADVRRAWDVLNRGGTIMIVTTMNDIPGYEIDDVYGEVFGLTVRSRNIGSQFGASIKSILGGELKGMTKALVDSRHEVMARMVAEAEAKGANAVIAMRFDTSEMGPNWTEICAYGTAARVHKA